VNATRPSNALATGPSLHERTALDVVNIVLRRASNCGCRSDGGPPYERILSITVRRRRRRRRQNRRDESAHQGPRYVRVNALCSRVVGCNASQSGWAVHLTSPLMS